LHRSSPDGLSFGTLFLYLKLNKGAPGVLGVVGADRTGVEFSDSMK